MIEKVGPSSTCKQKVQGGGMTSQKVFIRFIKGFPIKLSPITLLKGKS